jgi:uncharacterized protein YicC (UPF0701 family)
MRSLTDGRDKADRELQDAIRALEEALENVRRARRSDGGLDLETIRRALEHAERQLHAAQDRVRRALERQKGEGQGDAHDEPA